MQFPKDLFPNQIEAYKKLVHHIFEAFDGVILDNGIGLWEAQGIDDRLSPQECAKLRTKDEKKDWRNLKLADVLRCGSSPSFFDAKGLRFHLPYLLLYAIDYFEAEEDELMADATFHKRSDVPDIEYKLTAMLSDLNKTEEHHKMMLAYHNQQFSLLNAPQIQCIINFLEYRRVEVKTAQITVCEKCGQIHAIPKEQKYFDTLERAITYWQGQVRERLLANPKRFDITARILNKFVAEIYQYESFDELWCTATVLALPKNKNLQYANEDIHFALLLKIVALDEFPKLRLNAANCKKVFETVVEPYFNNFQFQAVEVSEFLDTYNEVMDGITHCKKATYTLNIQPINAPFLIEENHIIQIVRDLNQWNERAYFIETTSHFLYFDWSTGA